MAMTLLARAKFDRPAGDPSGASIIEETMRTTVALVLVASLAASLGAQQPPPAASQARPDPQMPPITFRSEVNYVEVDAGVFDAKGTFVRDLTRKDFTVFEDGKPQTVTAFTLVDIPVERSEQAAFLPKAIEPDVHSNAKAPDGRLYVLLLDDIHTDFRRTPQVRRIGKMFVDRYLGANDLMAVVHASGRTDVSQDFTNNRRLLDEAVDKFSGRKLRSATLNKMDDANMKANIPTAAGVPAIDPEEAERGYNARRLLATLSNLADYMAPIHGRRKAIVMIGEGIDYDINRPMELPDASTIRQDLQDAIGAATRANINLYPVDPRGLTIAGEDLVEMPGMSVDNPNAQGLGITALQDEMRVSQDSLRVLAGETGGFPVINTNDPRASLQQIVDDTSSYYVLGYYPANDKRDGKYRKIEVRLNRPGLIVKARKGYVAPTGKAPAPKKVDAKTAGSPALRDALNSPLQTPGLPFTVFAAPFKGPSPNATVAVAAQFSGSDLKFTETNGTFNAAVEMAYIVVNQQGKVVTSSSETVNMALKPETYKRVMRVGLRVQARVDVPPGKYSLRLALHETGNDRVGSVFTDIAIPEFTRDPLSMSGLVLMSASASQVPTTGSSELKDLLPSPPTTAREFSSGDTLAALAEVYDNLGPTPHAVEIATTIQSNEGRTVFSTSERRPSSELGGKRGGYGYLSKIPLVDMAPGLYVLKVEARASLGKENPSVAREVQFRIVR